MEWWGRGVVRQWSGGVEEGGVVWGSEWGSGVVGQWSGGVEWWGSGVGESGGAVEW